MFKLRRYLAGHYVECVLAPLFKGLEALLQLLVPLVMALDMGARVHRLVGEATAARRAVKRE